MKKSCAFTGPRALKLPWRFNENDARCIKLKEILRSETEKKIKQGVTTFYTGGQNGIDLIAGEIVIELKKVYDIKLIVVLPYETIADYWNENIRNRFFDMMVCADMQITLNSRYKKGCYRQRNEYIVKNSEALIAVFNESFKKRSDTYQAIKMARMRGLEIIMIEVDSGMNEGP